MSDSREPRLDRAPSGGDPLDVFRRLPGLEVDQSEIDAMKAAVATLRRSSEVASSAPVESRAPQQTSPWLRWARAAAVVALLTGALTLAPGRPGNVLPGVSTSIVEADAEIGEISIPAGGDPKVYEVSQGEVTGYWIVHPSLNLDDSAESEAQDL